MNPDCNFSIFKYKENVLLFLLLNVIVVVSDAVVVVIVYVFVVDVIFGVLSLLLL